MLFLRSLKSVVRVLPWLVVVTAAVAVAAPAAESAKTDSLPQSEPDQQDLRQEFYSRLRGTAAVTSSRLGVAPTAIATRTTLPNTTNGKDSQPSPSTGTKKSFSHSNGKVSPSAFTTANTATTISTITGKTVTTKEKVALLESTHAAASSSFMDSSSFVRRLQGHRRLWDFLQEFDGEAALDWSGWATAMNSAGTIVAIGTYASDAVRVFQTLDGGATWQPMGNAIDGDADTFFGYSIDMNDAGDRLAIGAISYDNASTKDGAVFVYDFDVAEGNWKQQGSLIGGSGGYRDQFGRSVAINGPGDIIAAGTFAGYVKVLKEQSDKTWLDFGTTSDGTGYFADPGDKFGQSKSCQVLLGCHIYF